MTTVYLIRHADVHNPRRVLYGHLEGFGLSELGRKQAAAVGQRLREEPPTVIVHSPLQRAHETAEIISAELPNHPPLVVDEGLLEAEFSRYLQGVPYWQVPLRRPLWFVHRARRGLLQSDESFGRLGGRVLEVMTRVARERPDQVSALVSHADPLQAAWILLTNSPRTEREMFRHQIARSGFLRVELEGTTPISVTYVAPMREAGEAPVEPASGAA